MMIKFGVVAAVAALLAAAPVANSAANAQANVTFSAADVGSATPLTVGTGANAVTFSSAVPGTFSVANTGLFSGLGYALGDYSSFSGDTLTLTFASPVTQSLALSFGLEDAFGGNGSDVLNLATNTGYTTTAGTTLDSSTFPEPEGTALVSATGYTTLSITSANPYAIGSVTSVPEPISLSVMAVSLAGFAVARRRRS